MQHVRVWLTCPDGPGIVARAAGFFAARGLNLAAVDQHSEHGRLAMRLEVELGDASPAALERDFADEVAAPLGAGVDWHVAGRRRRVGLLAGRSDHCLADLLWRFGAGELEGEVMQVIDSHGDHAGLARTAGAPYAHVPNPPGDPLAQHAAEERMAELLDGCELVVLARYMRVLSGWFLARVGCPAVNIHHSTLPAFAGAQPYQRAWERGVKLIGATAHYVTEELDAGPIIAQGVLDVGHRESAAELERLGRDVERVVLARAVSAHLQDRVRVLGTRTIVF